MREAYEHGWIKFDGAHLSLPLLLFIPRSQRQERKEEAQVEEKNTCLFWCRSSRFSFFFSSPCAWRRIRHFYIAGSCLHVTLTFTFLRYRPLLLDRREENPSESGPGASNKKASICWMDLCARVG